MQLKVINSNSSGNAYILYNEQEALLIECGVRFDMIKQALGFNLRKVVGCLLTHEHGDHAKSIAEVIKAGITVHSSAGTFEALNITSHRAVAHKNHQPFKAGRFTIIGFDVKHDVKEPFGYLIHHPETGNVLFLTDSYYCAYNFPGLNNIIIEANYSQSILDYKLKQGSTIKMLRDRVIESHMSLDTCKGMLKANDLSDVRNIVLIHLSDSNSNENQFKKEVEEATGKTVFIARPGLDIPFNKSAF